ncbi:type III secretion system translocon subunit SctE [Robbsia andropogonis]|uniref:type III secretion system translocon subunit SctE n=1 Tax=Robbsia andropogonis TaxID=28092 RepID=UPI001643356B|nr:type III secretion system translocon subunit SctE [Robbsia andropogonis]
MINVTTTSARLLNLEEQPAANKFSSVNQARKERASSTFIKVEDASGQKDSAAIGFWRTPSLAMPKSVRSRDQASAVCVTQQLALIGGVVSDAGPSGEALKQIGENVARWEASLNHKLDVHASTVNAFSDSVKEAEHAVSACLANTASPELLKAAVSATRNAVQLEAECTTTMQALPTSTQSLGVDDTRLLSSTAVLTIALARLEEMMSKCNIDTLDEQRTMLNGLAEKRQATLQQKSDDYAAKLAEAQRLQDTVGEIAKIGGWALTAIGVGLAIFTGGASLLIAAAGLALMAADAIFKAVTGTSFIDEAMKPVMDHAVKPMMTWLSKQVSEALESCGVPKEKAEIAGAVVAGIAVAAVMVTGVVAVGSVGGKIASVVAESTAKELGEVMESAVMRSVKDVMVKLADDTGVTSMASRAKEAFAALKEQVGLDNLEEGQINAIATRTRVGLTVGETGLSGAQAVIDTVAAADTRDASMVKASMTRILADKKVISEMLQELVNALSSSASAMRELNSAMSNTLKNEVSSETFLLNNARSI